jgi:uncharacterized pyridoxamine 5'-phosphate oxidase family protein
MQVEATEVLMQVRRTFKFLKDMGSAIKAHAATRQSETGFLPYRLYYVTARGKAVYKSMPVAES